MDRKWALEVLARDFSASSTECEADEYMTLAEAFDEYGLEYEDDADDTIDGFADSLRALAKSIRPSQSEIDEAVKVLSSGDYKVDRNLIILLLRVHGTIEEASKIVSMKTEDFKKKCCDFGIPTSHNEIKLFIVDVKTRASRDPGKEELIKAFVENDLVFVRVGKLYGVSDNAVRKWCKKYGIPTRKKELAKYMEEYRWLESNQR